MIRTSRFVSVLAAAAGAALLAYLLRRVGVSTVVQAIRLIGAGFLILVMLSGIRHLLRAVAWRCCVDPGAPSQRLVDLFTLRLIGESLTDLSPAGPILGETVKAWGVSKNIAARFGVTSVLIEDLIYSLGTGLFVIAGFLILLASTARKYHFVKPSGVMALLVLATIIFAIASKQRHLFERILHRIRNTSRGQSFIARYGQAARSWGTQIRDFFRTRRKLLLAVVSIEVAVNLISFAETYLILHGVTAHASLLNAYLVESANRGAQLVASFVPFGLGVDEGTTTAVLHSLGRTLSEGVSVATIRKIRSLFWDFVGLGLAAHFMMAKRVEGRGTSLELNQTADLPPNLEIAAVERIS
jgi:glycosyltransferase 2 family protein